MDYFDGGGNQKKLKNSAETQNDKFHPSEQKMGGGGGENLAEKYHKGANYHDKIQKYQF